MSGARLDPPRSALREGFEAAIRLVREAAVPDDPFDRLPVLALLDRLGEHDRVRGMLLEAGRRQRFGGAFEGTGSRITATACSLWSLMDHARLTGDLAYLKQVYPRVRRGLRWIDSQRTPLGSAEHSGLLDGREGDGLYAPTLWALTGAQEAARASATLARRSHQHGGEALFHDLNRALRRSLSSSGEEGSAEGYARDEAVAGEVLFPVWAGAPTDHDTLGRTLDLLMPRPLTPRTRGVLGLILLERGDPRVWEVVDGFRADAGLPADPTVSADPDSSTAAFFALLVRSLLVSDQRNMLMVAPGWALRPLPDGGVVEADAVPTLHGPLGFRLGREGDSFTLAWEPLRRGPPEHVIWPLPGLLWRAEPPRISLTGSRRAIRLDPDGGRLSVVLVPGSLPAR